MSAQARAHVRSLSIIGSSNSRRIFGKHLSHLSVLTGSDANFKGATTFTTGAKACENLKGNDIAIISFITNTLVDECGSAGVGELEGKIMGVLSRYIEVIKNIPETVTVIF